MKAENWFNSQFTPAYSGAGGESRDRAHPEKGAASARIRAVGRQVALGSLSQLLAILAGLVSIDPQGVLYCSAVRKKKTTRESLISAYPKALPRFSTRALAHNFYGFLLAIREKVSSNTSGR